MAHRADEITRLLFSSCFCRTGSRTVFPVCIPVGFKFLATLRTSKSINCFFVNFYPMLIPPFHSTFIRTEFSLFYVVFELTARHTANNNSFYSRFSNAVKRAYIIDIVFRQHLDCLSFRHLLAFWVLPYITLKT